MQAMRPDFRGLADSAKTMWEQETLQRLNPHGAARPDNPPPDGPTLRQQLRLLWSRLRALWRLK